MDRNFLSTADLSRDEIEDLIDKARRLKDDRKLGGNTLKGSSIALVFFNPSLRTRASMQVGIHELGGNAVMVEPGGTSWTLEHREGAVMDGAKTEHLKEFVRVLERYVSAIGVRTFADLENWELERTDPVLNAFTRYSSKPIINLESAMHHPCQATADMMTIREQFGSAKKRVLLTWAWHPKALPMAVPNSFALAAAQSGHELVIAHPEGYELDAELMRQLDGMAEQAGGSVRVTNQTNDAYDGVDVVYAKSWGSSRFYGNAAGDIEFRSALREEWIVDEPKMARTDNAIFMHCLPVRRNVIVTDGVIDSPRSVVIDQAENRLHVQKAIISELVK